MGSMGRLVAATHNPGKLAEMRRLLAPLPLEVIGLAQGRPPPPETGETYLENALIKARAAAAATGLACFADDSGLEVDALDGAPGVRSARFDGDAGTPESRNRHLLDLLEGVAPERRTARFRAVVALVLPAGSRGPSEHVFEGVFEGLIAPEASGEGGFGYDPVFLVPAFGVTVACLPARRKDELSHRGRALRAMAGYIRGRLEAGTWP
jgi:XTP/dITP diphosphohydrolase